MKINKNSWHFKLAIKNGYYIYNGLSDYIICVILGLFKLIFMAFLSLTSIILITYPIFYYSGYNYIDDMFYSMAIVIDILLLVLLTFGLVDMIKLDFYDE